MAQQTSLAIGERRVLLASLDVVLLALVSAVVSWRAPGPGSVLALALPMTIAWLLVGHVNGLYDLATATRLRRCLAAIGRVAMLVGGLLILLFYLSPYVASRPKLLALAVVGPLVLSAWRLAYIRLGDITHFERRVLVVGAGEECVALLRAIGEQHGHGVTVVGVLDDQHPQPSRELEGIPLSGNTTNLRALINRLGAQEVVLATSTPSDEIAGMLFEVCYERGVAVSLMAHLYEEITGQIPVDYVGRHWLGAVVLHRPGGRLYATIKRGIDLVVSGVSLVLAAPVMGMVALMVRLGSPGPILYRQTRVGQHGLSFQIVKFRTMHIDAEQEGEAIWATRDDPRTTTMGKWLRRTHLDELPQLVLVLQGRMSLVGPRPERPEFVRQLSQQIPLYAARGSMRPGVTGWAQVRYPYGSTVADSLAKLRYDLYYVKNCSFLLDLTILMQTLVRVLSMNGR